MVFPSPESSTSEGIVAVGGDLSTDRLLLAYQNGIFPWFNENEPILWWSPDPRCVLYARNLNVSRSMRPYLNQNKYRLTCDQDFEQVLDGCKAPREKQEGTWISREIKDAYLGLHRLGYAHSVEVWKGEELVGGLYGVSLGKCFFGESMFCRATNASKFALIRLSQRLEELGFHFIDCQVYNSHLGTLGAIDIPRNRFLKELRKGLAEETMLGNWSNLFSESIHVD